MQPSAASTSEEDRRNDPRYRVEDTVFVTFRPRFDVVGYAVDVSENGLAFEYTAFGDTEASGLVEVDIFCQPRKVNLAHVPCRIMYDYKVDDAPTFRGFQTRRCGLQFGQVPADQMERLQAFLKSYEIDSTSTE